jgi:chemotaxis protein MotB
MRKRKEIEEPINHERWLVSYADFITLLFAFFVVMYSLSSLNEGKYRIMSDSVNVAFGKFKTLSNNQEDSVTKLTSGAGTGVGPSSSLITKKTPNEEKLKQEREKMTELAQGVLKSLAPLIREGKVRVTQTSLGISIDINASVLFAPAEAKLTTQSNEALTAIASVLASDTHDIQVEGHTDNLPIKTGNFPSNWELSAVRAGSVVRLFMDNGIAESRLTAIGQGAKMPVDSNDTPEGRARNRRVNITILSMLPDKRTDVPIGNGNDGTP